MTPFDVPWLDPHTRRVLAGAGCGIDVATQRADDLDESALTRLSTVRLERPGYRPSALDLACGAGGQAFRLAKAGARVVAVDQQDQSQAFMTHAATLSLAYPPRFLVGDMTALPPNLPEAPYDVICWQRALHYLPYQEACAALTALIPFLAPHGRLYVSASGLPSELGQDYAHRDRPVMERFAPLAPAMAARHGIERPVCLYRAGDLVALLHAAGWGISHVFASPFGNIKAVAFAPFAF